MLTLFGGDNKASDFSQELFTTPTLRAPRCRPGRREGAASSRKTRATAATLNPRAGDARSARHGSTQTPTHHNPETIIMTIRHKLLTATVASAISAVAGFAPAAHAADVTLYGSIDTGILF